tara:strand:+ start:216 stop:710 length:495 start_codon:yes stop_codon:yes gene_type:complete
MKQFCDLLIGKWGCQIKGCHFPCSVGRSGIGKKTHEGDGITPEGTWRLMFLMVRCDRLRINVNHKINIRDVWSDDPLDPEYNHLRKPNSGFSCERLWRSDPLYDLIGVTNFNWPTAVPGVGSAIFLHTWRKPRHPTEGCIGFALKDLSMIFKLWEPRSKLIIKA